MSWTIKVSSNAEKYYNRLDKKLKERIRNALLDLSKYEKPLEHPQVKALTGDLKGFFRLRVGDYGIIFGLIEESKIIAIVNIFPRAMHTGNHSNINTPIRYFNMSSTAKAPRDYPYFHP